MPEAIGYSRSSVALALTNAYQAFALSSLSTEAASEGFPSKCLIDWMHGQIDSIAGGATSVTWFLAWDVTGDIPIVPVTTTNILVGMTTATKGGISAAIGTRVRRPSGVGDAEKVYLIAKLNAGTCNMTPRLYHVR